MNVREDLSDAHRTGVGAHRPTRQLVDRRPAGRARQHRDRCDPRRRTVAAVGVRVGRRRAPPGRSRGAGDRPRRDVSDRPPRRHDHRRPVSQGQRRARAAAVRRTGLDRHHGRRRRPLLPQYRHRSAGVSRPGARRSDRRGARRARAAAVQLGARCRHLPISCRRSCRPTTAVPGEFANLWRMSDAQYMPASEMIDPELDPSRRWPVAAADRTGGSPRRPAARVLLLNDRPRRHAQLEQHRTR